MTITAVASLTIASCNNSGKSSVNNADSANASKIDSGAISLSKDEADFMVTVANGGMTEIALGKLAQQKAHKARVRDFGAMMVRDHSQAGDQLKALAINQNVTLPDSLSEDSKDDLEKLSKKKGSDFDKAYMDLMVDGHQKTAKSLQSELGDVKNPGLRQWITATLPIVQMHLDSAQVIDSLFRNSRIGGPYPTTAP